jgi:hypothetical protein
MAKVETTQATITLESGEVYVVELLDDRTFSVTVGLRDAFKLTLLDQRNISTLWRRMADIAKHMTSIRKWTTSSMSP